MNIVFLDYDGVVNTPIVDGTPIKMCYPSDNRVNNTTAVKLIQQLCEDCNCHIVVISSWRYETNYAECLYNSGLSKDIPIIEFMPFTLNKTEVIQNFLSCNQIDNYIVIDDKYIEGIPKNKFINCNFNFGFGIKEFNASLKILNN